VKNSQNSYWSNIHKIIFLKCVDLKFIYEFFYKWIRTSCIILKNLRNDSKKYNIHFLSILYNTLFKYPLLGFLPIDFFCYRLYDNNYKDYISNIEFYSKITRKSSYFSYLIDNKYIFKKAVKDKIKISSLIAYYDKDKDILKKFVEPTNNKIVIKPAKGYWGNDIKIVNSDNYIETLKKSKESSIAEEYIYQHHLINEIFSGCVNTLRIITYNKNGDFILIKGTLKVGQNPNLNVDNVSKGGIGINLNLKTGVLGNGYTSYNYGLNEYKSHPISKYHFFGETIPYLEEVKDLAISAHRCFPMVKIVGWDIAITETGPIIVEGNIYPNITGMQIHEPLRKKLLNLS